MKKIIMLFLTGVLYAYPNTLSVWEIFPSSYTQEQIDFYISSATSLTSDFLQPAQIAYYENDNGKALLKGDFVIDNLAIFNDAEKTKFWCHYGFDTHGFIIDTNFDIMQDAFYYLHTATYTVHPTTPTIGMDYEIDGDTYTIINATWTVGGSTFVIEGQEYTVSTNTISTTTLHVIGAKGTGFWATGIGGIIAVVWGGIVYFFRKKES